MSERHCTDVAVLKGYGKSVGERMLSSEISIGHRAKNCRGLLLLVWRNKLQEPCQVNWDVNLFHINDQGCTIQDNPLVVRLNICCQGSAIRIRPSVETWREHILHPHSPTRHPSANRARKPKSLQDLFVQWDSGDWPFSFSEPCRKAHQRTPHRSPTTDAGDRGFHKSHT